MRTLKIENGQCHGDFALNHTPFYSGFYEIRAYTRYMLNSGESLIFSRLLPVYDKPETAGDFEEKTMLNYNGALSRFPMKREKPVRGDALNVRFFPEGGQLVRGVSSRIAFEATDRFGNPVEITGVVAGGDTAESFTSLHEGRGMFTHTPVATESSKVEVDYSGKKYRFILPEVLPQGVVMEVDNLSEPYSIGITLRKNSDTSVKMLGVAILSGGKLQNAVLVPIESDRVRFNIDKTELPAGVSQIVLFDEAGTIIADRLVFVSPGEGDSLNIAATPSKLFYMPYERVEIDFSVTDGNVKPVSIPFSLSVRDAASEVEAHGNILTDLLLMSEIKGYVRNPLYYFESDDPQRHARLDELLMVQGWRRYSWNRMVGIEPFEVKYLPEQGVEVHGRVASVTTFGGRERSVPDVDVSLYLRKMSFDANEPTADSIIIDSFPTDSLGQFSFVTNVAGKWSMILGATDGGKKKDYKIVLDRLFSPTPRKYSYTDMQRGRQRRIIRRPSHNMARLTRHFIRPTDPPDRDRDG